MSGRSVIFLCLLVFSIFNSNLFASASPGDLCQDGGCTTRMQEILNKFEANPYPVSKIPAMYAGDCFHMSPYLDGEYTHYLGALFESDYMAPVFQYFGDGNDMAGWDLETARREMSPDWRTYGKITDHPTSSTAAVYDNNGGLAYYYWARQNPTTKTIYFLAYARGWSYAFCEINKTE